MNVIVAAYTDWGIGKDGTQPVVVPEDRKFFRETTAGGTVIVGRKTLADFPGGRPLKNRRNIVLSSDKSLVIDGAETAHSVEEAIKLASSDDADKVFVIGGAGVYRQMTEYCRYAYVTRVHACPKSDSFFENLDSSKSWIKLSETPIQESENGVSFSVAKYENLDVKKPE